jgi:ATP synthase F1 gamma subunit
MAESRKYGETANEVFDAAETAAPETEQKKSLIIVCSSDKGLCGGVHSGLSRRIRALSSQVAEPFDLVILGEKCKAQLQRTNASSIQLSFAGVGKDIPTFASAQAIADQIVMLPTEYTDVKILYNKFINAQSYEPTFIEAFSEEAISQSRTFKISCSARKLVQRANFVAIQPTSPHLRSRRMPLSTSASTVSPTTCTGLWPKATPARSLPDEMPWT